MASSTESVKAAVFVGPGQPFRLEELRLDPPGPGEVRVRMVASGICHSDLHVVDGDWQRPFPLVGGHEGAAIVEGAGDGVADRFSALTPGALVVLAWTAPCGSCGACARGEGWLCSQPLGDGHRMRDRDVRLRRADGTAVGAYCGIGTFGTRQVVAAEAAIPVDPRTPAEVAALIGCAVATGVGAVMQTARVVAGESVAIVGLGGVGLSAVMGAKLAGADPIVALDTQPAKLELARSLGATATVKVDPADPARAEADACALAPAGGFDHAFECIGIRETCEMAVTLVRRGGTATWVGMTPQGTRAGVDVYRLVDDGKRILGSNYGSSVPSATFPWLADVYRAGSLPVERLVSETIPIEAVNDALEAMRRGDGARRVIVY